MNFRKKLVLPLVYLFLVISFIVLGFFIVTYAAGYTVDFKSRQISSTGLISLQVKTGSAQIYLNEKYVGNQSMVLRSLEDGTYRIVIKKEGYHDWQKTVQLHEQEALILENIVLFIKEPTLEQYNSNITVKNLPSMSDQDGLYFNKGEIFNNDELVTRLSKDVSGVCWFPDQNHIAFTSEGFLQIIDADGNNNIQLIKKDSNSPVIFTNSGRFVIFENEGKLVKAKIR